MKHFSRFVVVSAAVALASMPEALGQDLLKVAGAQRGVWETAAVALGQEAAIYKKHGVELDLVFLDDVRKIEQSVISGEADVGLAVGTMTAIRAFYFGAPIRIIGASLAGSANYWYVSKSSPIQSFKEISGKAVGYERNGSSSQYDAIDYLRSLRVKAKLMVTGGPAATFDHLSAGHIDVGWAAPPFGIDKIDEGTIRVIGRANDMPQIRDKTVGVIITNRDTLEKRKAVLVRFLQAYGETIDWMYSDPAALQRFAATSGLSESVVRRLRDEFFPKEMLLPNRIVGLKDIIKDAIVLDYIHTGLSRKQIATLVQIVTPEPAGRWQILRRLRDRLR